MFPIIAQRALPGNSCSRFQLLIMILLISQYYSACRRLLMPWQSTALKSFHPLAKAFINPSKHAFLTNRGKKKLIWEEWNIHSCAPQLFKPLKSLYERWIARHKHPSLSARMHSCVTITSWLAGGWLVQHTITWLHVLLGRADDDFPCAMCFHQSPAVQVLIPLPSL